MNYTKEERLEIGRKIFENGWTSRYAASIYGIGEESARRYYHMYVDEHDIEVTPKLKTLQSKAKVAAEINSEYNSYSSMTKDELIEELMKAKIRESRLKKGYMVKGAGASKEYILLDIKSTK